MNLQAHVYLKTIDFRNYQPKTQTGCQYSQS